MGDLKKTLECKKLILFLTKIYKVQKNLKKFVSSKIFLKERKSDQTWTKKYFLK